MSFIHFIIVFNHIHIVVHLKIILTQMCIGQVLKSTTLQYFNNFLLIFYKLITIKMFCSLIESGYIKTYSNLYIFISKIKVDCFCWIKTSTDSVLKVLLTDVVKALHKWHLLHTCINIKYVVMFKKKKKPGESYRGCNNLYMCSGIGLLINISKHMLYDFCFK